MQQANGQNYFCDTNYHITLKKVVDRDPNEERDLTEKKHSHNFHELVIILSGDGVHWVEGIEFPVTAGDVLLVQGNQEHYFKELNELTFYNVMFKVDELKLPIDELKKIPGYHAMFILSPKSNLKQKYENMLHLSRKPLAYVQTILDGMIDEAQQKNPGFEASLYFKLIELIVYLSRQYAHMDTGARGQSLQRVTKVIGEIEGNYQKQWKLAELAKIACMSEGNLMRIFKEATEQSPIDYLIHLRIQKAMGFLRNTNMQITEIAYNIGFNDSNYFTRHFKKISGQSPRQYRQKHKLI